MIKKIIVSVLAATALSSMVAYAATPMLTFSGNGSGTVGVNISGGESNAPVVLYSNNGQGVTQSWTIGSTNASGSFTGMFNGNFSGMNWNSPAYVQVGGYQSNSVAWPSNGMATGNMNGSVTFSQSSPTMNVGQNGSIMLSGGNGNYYIASNSNASGITPSISGNMLTLSGQAAGSGSIVVCSTDGGCGTIYPTVQSQSGSPSLSNSNLTFTSGAQGSVNLSGGSGPYTVSIPQGSGISTTLMGNTLYVNGTATGTTMLSICSQNGSTSNGGCSMLTVNVASQASASTNTPSTSPSNNPFPFTIPLTVGQAFSLNLGGSGYYLGSSGNGTAMASVNNGNTLMMNGSMVGNGSLTVCQNGGSCYPVNFTVAPSVAMSTNNNSTLGTGGGYFFEANLGLGDRGQDVTELQNRLKEEGHFSAESTGYFGSLTAKAVMHYQSAHSISTTGFVGPLTRAELNK